MVSVLEIEARVLKSLRILLCKILLDKQLDVLEKSGDVLGFWGTTRVGNSVFIDEVMLEFNERHSLQ